MTSRPAAVAGIFYPAESASSRTGPVRSPERQDTPGMELLLLARGSIAHGLAHRLPLPVRIDELPPALQEPGATFTTLRIDSKLRGCCGTLEAAQSLATDVTYSAFQAAFHDPRFNPVGKDELDAIRLEVSVLSPMEPLHVLDEAHLLQMLTPGIDGLVVVEGERRATFLPKVWEMLPEPGEFLAQLRAKAGLPKDYWSERLEFSRYRTTTFTESV